MSNYGIPYMGSKGELIHKLAPMFPKAENFYDLFGGGFAVSHFMAFHKKYPRVIYNEIKSDVVQLVRDAIAWKYNYDVFKPEWISREAFELRKHNDAYVRCIWSFGNNQKGYLFGEENERCKKSLHQAVVFNEFDDYVVSILKIKSFPSHLSIRGRRLMYRSIITRKGLRGDLEQLERLERLQRLEQLEQLERLERLQRLEQLERLQRLQRLERLEQLEQLELISKSYDEVEILPNSVIYCDPPYKGTAGYLSSFDHVKFWQWVRGQPQPVFVSEYNAPPDIRVIAAFNKKTRLSSKGMTDTVPEKLFGNDAAYKSRLAPLR